MDTFHSQIYFYLFLFQVDILFGLNKDSCRALMSMKYDNKKYMMLTT